MITERALALQIAAGTLPSPQAFMGSWYWSIRISGTGAMWRGEPINEFCWREPRLWLSPDMVARASALPVLVDHPEGGALTSQEFAKRCVGLTIHAYVLGDELWAIARIVDAGANAILLDGFYRDTSPAVSFEPGAGARSEINGKPLLVEAEPMLFDHIALCAQGRWSRDGPPTGVENEIESSNEHESI